MTAADSYVARIDAIQAQEERLRGGPRSGDRWDSNAARRFRVDPHRPLDAILESIAAHLRPDDVVVDVGGGAGRLGLPLASRCRELIDVEPAAEMARGFQEVAAEAGIHNARVIQQDWLAATGVEGDVALVAHVTYFVRDIKPFIEKLVASVRRRVIICVGTPPPPTQNATVFRAAFGEDQVAVPGHTELLPVLWEMGILPDVRAIPGPMNVLGPLPQTRDEALGSALIGMDGGMRERPQKYIEEHFDELFARTEAGLRPLWRPEIRQLLITWETNSGG